jgi:hypothetical protein
MLLEGADGMGTTAIEIPAVLRGFGFGQQMPHHATSACLVAMASDTTGAGTRNAFASAIMVGYRTELTLPRSMALIMVGSRFTAAASAAWVNPARTRISRNVMRPTIGKNILACQEVFPAMAIISRNTKTGEI